LIKNYFLSLQFKKGEYVIDLYNGDCLEVMDKLIEQEL
jgi:hypothetical protein